MTTRIALGCLGFGCLAYGVFRYLSLDLPTDSTVGLMLWLAIGVVVHDLVIAPVVFAVGWSLSRVVPPRWLGPIQLLLAAAALTTAFGAVLVWREGTARSPSLALLEQNYAQNLAIVLAGQSVLIGLALLVRTARHRAATKSRPA